MGGPKIDSANVPIGVQWLRELRDVDVLPTSLYTDNTITKSTWLYHANLTTVAYSFMEPSRWTVYGEGLFVSEQHDTIWSDVRLRVEYNLNAAGWTTLAANPEKKSFLYANVGDANDEQSISHSWRWEFAFVGPTDTIAFRLGYYASAGNLTFTNAMFYIDVDKG